MRRALVMTIALGVAVTTGFFCFVILALASPSIIQGLKWPIIHFAGSLFAAVEDGNLESVYLAVTGATAVGLLVLTVPVTLAAVVGEVWRIRTFVWYGGVPAAFAAGLPFALPRTPDVLAPGRTEGDVSALTLVFVTGAVTGLVYWLLAGRNAGTEPVAQP